MQTAAAEAAAAGSDAAKAKAAANEAHETWESVEDSVRAKERDLYVEIEDALESLEAAAGDQAKVAQSSADLTKALSAYLAKHPG